MYSRIVLTLDRSPLAEQSLPHAVALAKAFHAAVEVVSVVPVAEVEGPAFGAHGDWEAEVAEYEEYLAGIVSRIRDEGLKVRSQIRRGEITEEILRHVKETEADLIVMSTHGRSGRGRWVYGSIADRVLRHAPVPVLLVRATEA